MRDAWVEINFRTEKDSTLFSPEISLNSVNIDVVSIDWKYEYDRPERSPPDPVSIYTVSLEYDLSEDVVEIVFAVVMLTFCVLVLINP